MNPSEPDHERGPRCEDITALELVNLTELHGGDRLPARALGHGVAIYVPAAPRGQDDLRIAPHDLLGRNATPRRASLPAQLGEDVAAASDLDQLRHPADAGNQRIRPLLEIDPGPIGPHRRVLTDLLHLVPDVL